jgi:hypothetical protein
MRVVEALEPVIGLMPSSLSVRIVQGTGRPMKNVSFGRLGWNDRSHRKWTHFAPETDSECPAWSFGTGEVWTPSWTVCEREASAPNLFCAFENAWVVRAPAGMQFNQFFHLALPVSTAREQRGVVSAAVRTIAGVVEASHVLARTAPWREGGWCLQDEINNGLHYLEMYPRGTFEPAKARVEWGAFEDDAWSMTC